MKSIRIIASFACLLIVPACAVSQQAGDRPTEEQGEYEAVRVLYVGTDTTPKLQFQGIDKTNEAALAKQCHGPVMATPKAAAWPLFFITQIINFSVGQISQRLAKRIKEYTYQSRHRAPYQEFFSVAGEAGEPPVIEGQFKCIQVTRATCKREWQTDYSGGKTCPEGDLHVEFDLVVALLYRPDDASNFRLEPLQLYYARTNARSDGSAKVEIRAKLSSIWRSNNEPQRKTIVDDPLVREKLTINDNHTVVQIGEGDKLKTYPFLGEGKNVVARRFPVPPWSTRAPGARAQSGGELTVVVTEIGDVPLILKYAHKFLSANQAKLAELAAESIAD